MPVERARSAAPAESQEGAPARSELEAALRHRFNGLSEEERIRECFYDSNTGLPNERGFEILRGGAARADSLYAHYSIEGPKWINDVFTHDQGQMLYRMAACALHSAAPNVAKVRGDFIGAVASMEDARERAAAANRALPEAFRGFTITVHVGPAWDDLGVQHGAWKDQEERAGRRAGRGERPFGVEPRWTPKEGPFPGATVRQPVHADLARAYRQLGPVRAQEAYRDPATGLLSHSGMGAAAREGDAVLSMDVDGLKATDRYQSGLADEVVRRVGSIMRILGGDEVRAAHPHGDEYGAAHPDPEVLRAYAEDVREILSQITVTYTDPELGETFVQRGIGVSYGVGGNYVEAERVLEHHKTGRAGAGERDRKGESRLAEQRLERRAATEAELRRACSREGRARGRDDLGTRNAQGRGGTADARGDRARPAQESRGQVGATPGQETTRRFQPPGREGRCPALHAKGVRPQTLTAPEFAGRWQDTDGGALFQPRPGRVFWESSAGGDVRRIILTEKPIDAMSYHQLRGAEGPVQYISTEGPLQPAQLAKLKQVIADHAGRQRDRLVVVAAFGNSRDGAGLAREVQAIVPAGVHLERAAPEIRGTWNDRLQAKERDYIRSQGVRQMGRGLERER